MKMTCSLSKIWKYLRTNKSEIEFCKSSQDIKKSSSSYVNFVGKVLDMLKVNHCSWNYMLPPQMLKGLSSLLPGPELHSNSCCSYKLTISKRLTDHLNIMSPTLKSLTITPRDLWGDNMEKILSTCPALQELRLYSCQTDCLNIFSPTLTKLEIQLWDECIPYIDISAPYIRELKIRGEVNKTDFRLRDIKSLVRASVCFRGSVRFYDTARPEDINKHMIYMTELLQSLQYVKELELGQGCLKSLSRLVAEGLNIPTSRRSCLILTLGEKVSMPGILCILKSSPFLETLTINGDCSYLFEKYEDVEYLENIDLVFHHLKTINITLCEGEPLILVEFFLKNSIVLQKMIVSCKFKYETTEKLSMALLAFPRASLEAKVVLDSCASDICRGTRRHLLPSGDRWISCASWLCTIKRVWTGQKTTDDVSSAANDDGSFTLHGFAESEKRYLRSKSFFLFKRLNGRDIAIHYVKRLNIIEYLAKFDPYGSCNIQTYQKQDTAKQCNCTLVEVEDALKEIAKAKKKHYQMKEKEREKVLKLGRLTHGDVIDQPLDLT